jgi:hypothetical protein
MLAASESTTTNHTSYFLQVLGSMAGDDIEDDYTPDELVAVDDDESFDEFFPLDGEEDQFVNEDPVSPQGPRKRVAPPAGEVGEEEAKREKRKRKRQKENEKKAKVS